MKVVTLSALAIATILVVRHCGGDSPDERWRVATFNIEDFPKNARQVEAAFDEIAGLDASIVAVQEIRDPALFAGAAQRRLGKSWQFVHVSTAPLAEGTRPTNHLGVLFDDRRYRLVQTRVHDETRLEGRQKPTLDVELQSTSDEDESLRVLVVHLKSGGEHQDIRKRQLYALAGIVNEAKWTGARVILLGDFNSTGDGDRQAIGDLKAATGMSWATELLDCSAFWDRDDGCPRSRLDHVMVSGRFVETHAAGACAREGCDWQDSCPLYAEQVSDHCPVVVTF
jgi:endonuclease/exonuclease/phosphatase family metal-dependent hydrolase